MAFDGIITVYNKRMERLAVFPPNSEAVSEDAMRNMMVRPTIRQCTNGESTFSYEMLSDSESWEQIKDVENLYHVNDKWYTVLSNDAYEYRSDDGVNIVSVVALETWSLLSKCFGQIYNCGLYVYCRSSFVRYTTDGAVFTLTASGASNPGKTISSANAWEQVKLWQATDKAGNKNSFAILTADEYKPTGWESPPSAVFLKSLVVSGNTATMTVESRTKHTVNTVFQYNPSRTYTLDAKPLPSKIDKVTVNTTTVVEDADAKKRSYTTVDKEVYNYSYNASTGVVTVNYYPAGGNTEFVNGVTISHTDLSLGEISPGATCVFAFGPEVVDDTTIKILPKSDTRYKLHINGVAYEDSQVRDSRNVIMPRGSAGYAVWALLKASGTDWTLGVCDVLAKGFNANDDYGVFNNELDQKDILYAIQSVVSLYGGILQWDSEHKVVHLRAENSTDYQAYNDGFNEWSGHIFREGKNMTEKPVITVDSELITRAYLLGFGNLNIKGVNNGSPYIEDHSFTDAVYTGYLTQSLIYDTNTVGEETSGQKQLLYWGRKELAKQCRPRERVTLSVTDLRYLPEYSHEQFFLNDVVKVIYEDEYLGKKVEKEQRVIVWEYNAHALWDCTVELGDTTLNKIDLFKLIYKKVENSPAPDNSGNISGGNIDMSGSSNNQNSLLQYIELIARTTTENSDAIAGLILDTDANHAQVDLFAYYQKHMDNLLAESYAGLTFYADEKKAEAILSAQHYSEQQVRDAEGRLTTVIAETKAGIIAYVDDEVAQIGAVAEARWKTLSDQLNEEIKARGELSVTLTKEVSNLNATIEQQWKNTQGEITSAIAGLRSEVSRTYATSAMFSAFQTTVDNQLRTTAAEVRTYTDNEIAAIQLTADAYNGYCSLTLTQHGVYIAGGRVEFRDYDPWTWNNSAAAISGLQRDVNTLSSANTTLQSTMNSLSNRMAGWTYGGTTYINGEMIATDTLYVSRLKGGYIYLLDAFGREAGYFTVQLAQSYVGYKVDLTAGAISLLSTNGDISLIAGMDVELTGSKVKFTGNSGVESNREISVVSDRNKKHDIDYDMTAYLDVFDKLKPCSFKMDDSHYERRHTGLIAQDVEDALDECGIDTQDFAAIVKYTDEETEEEYCGLRYGEFVSLCIAKIQQQDAEIKSLKDEIAQIKAALDMA